MKLRALVLSSLAVALVVPLSYRYSRAASESESRNISIGIVSIRKIFQDSKRVSRYRQQVMAERQSTEAKLNKLAKEIEAEEAGLKILKAGSNDYLSQYRQILQKRADLRTEQEFFNQKMSLVEKKVTEELYSDILGETREIAKQKGLFLVLERSEPELPASGPTQLEMLMGTHKVLYSDGCMDITAEVMTRLDARETSQ